MRVPGRHTVLIVDNCEEILLVLEKEFQKAGFDSRVTWSGHEALEWLKTGEIDVLVVDDYLPDLHCSDFLVRVGRLRSTRPIIVMQDRLPTTADLRHFDSLGASIVVDKRFPEHVRQAVASCCTGKSALKLPAGRAAVGSQSQFG
jgi:DNA-binding response OmpR family regulator